jgi:hypothetical protein
MYSKGSSQMQNSGVDAAIRELEREVGQIRDVIGKLRRIRAARGAQRSNSAPKRRLSAEARKRIALAARKRWAAFRAKKS